MKRNFRILALALSLALFIVSFPVFGFDSYAASGNLLKNPGAESKLRGWTVDSGSFMTTRGIGKSPCKPHGGKYFFMPSCEYGSASMHQDYKITGNMMGAKLTLSAYMAVWNQDPYDTARMQLSYYDENGAIIGSPETVECRTPKWMKYQIKSTIPYDTDIIRVTLIGICSTGPDVDAYFDDLVLKSSVSPSKGSGSTSSNDSGNLSNNEVAKPSKVTITKVKLTSRTKDTAHYLIKYKKIANNCTAYEIQASKNKSFPNNKSTLSYKTPNNSMTQIYLNLKRKSKGVWYVRVRAINKSGSKVVSGNWSKVKLIKVK